MRFLFEALWAHRILRHRATKVTPFELVYGQEAMLLVEVNLDAYRLARQNDLSAAMYRYDDGQCRRGDGQEIEALKEIEKDKARVAKPYNKKVRSKLF